jgi:hypothetical protein
MSKDIVNLIASYVERNKFDENNSKWILRNNKYYNMDTIIDIKIGMYAGTRMLYVNFPKVANVYNNCIFLNKETPNDVEIAKKLKRYHPALSEIIDEVFDDI